MIFRLNTKLINVLQGNNTLNPGIILSEGQKVFAYIDTNDVKYVDEIKPTN